MWLENGLLSRQTASNGALKRIVYSPAGHQAGNFSRYCSITSVQLSYTTEQEHKPLNTHLAFADGAHIIDLGVCEQLGLTSILYCISTERNSILTNQISFKNFNFKRDVSVLQHQELHSHSKLKLVGNAINVLGSHIH